MHSVLSEAIIDEIKSRTNIVDVVGKYVNIKRTGNNYKGLCPFHSEKSPSFVVSEDKQIFTCFGCGATGDVIEFLKRIENIDFIETIERLAKECGIELKEHSGSTNEKKKQQLYQINRDAALFFYNNLNSKENNGNRYLHSRGLEPSIIKKFGLGYAEKSWDHLYKYLKSKNIDEKILLDLGLVSFSKERYYDKFRNRVIFPIINTRGKVIGFGGRAIDDSTPKYLNSPESIVFQKKNNLYGLNLSRQDIQKHDYIIIVEGYMDVISLYSKGIKNVGASLGTALTINQAQVIKRYTHNVIVAYDSDEAGQAAAFRGMDILYEAGCKVKILQMEGSKDPDEYVKAYGVKSFKDCIKNAVPIIEYKIKKLREQHDLSIMDGRVDFVKEVAKVLSKVKSHIEVDAYLHKIAAETKISESAIKLEINGNNKNDSKIIIPSNDAKQQLSPKKPFGKNDFFEKTLIKLIVTRSEFVPKIKESTDIFADPMHQRMFSLIIELYREDEEIDIAKLKDALSEEEDINELEAILNDIQLGGKEEVIFQDCINKIKIDRLKKRQEDILKILQILNEDEDKIRIDQLTQELVDIQKKLIK
ncbi:MAG: DNA primase [Clostridia bacterium]|nr:DNA primase [Clostridia bacterium]